MEDLGVRIKVDATQAEPAIAGVEKGLASVEAKGPSISTSLSKGFRDGGEAAGKAKKGIDDAADSLKRQQDILDKIHGPAREFAADMQALDALYRKNAISAEQYTQQVKRLHEELAKKQEGGGGPAEGFERTTSILTGLAAGGAAGEAVELAKRIGDVVEEEKRLEDEQIRLVNSVQMFAIHGRTANGIIQEQVELSEELHSKLDPTIALYQRVAENSDRLAFSHEHQIALTKTLGDAVVLANHPLEDASSIMARFAVMMETGTADARGFLQIQKEAPALVKVWESAFHESWSQIVADMKNGKKTADDMVMALVKNGESLDPLMAKRQKTNEELKDEWLQHQKLQYAHERELDFNGKLDEAMGRTHDSSDALDIVVKKVNASFEEEAEKAKALAVAVGEDLLDATHKAIVVSGELGGTLESIGRVLGVVKDEWSSTDSTFMASTKVAMEHAAAVGQAKKDLEALVAAHKAGAFSADEFRTKYRSLTDTIEGGRSAERTLLYEVDDATRKYNQDIAALIDLQNRGALSARAFQTEMAKVIQAAPDYVKGITESTIGNFRGQHGGMSGSHLGTGAGFLSLATPDTLAEQVPDVDQDRAVELYNASRTAAQKYSEELAELDRLYAAGKLNDTAYAQTVDDLATRFGKVRTAGEEFARGMRDLDQKFAVGLLDLKSYTEASDDLRMKLNQNADVAVGFREGLRSIASDINVAADAQKTLVDGFNGARDAIGQLVTTGTADIGKFVDTILADFARLATDKLLRDLLSSGGGGGGAALVNQALGAFGVGPIGGGATGGEFTIPHAASGFAGIVKHKSGMDNYLAMFHVNAGEQVQIRTPEQQRAAASSGGGYGPVNVSPRFVMQWDPRSLLDVHENTAEGQAMQVRMLVKNGKLIQALARG